MPTIAEGAEEADTPVKSRCDGQVRLPGGSRKPAFHGVLRHTCALNDSGSNFAIFRQNETTLQSYLRFSENRGCHIDFVMAEVSRLLQDPEGDIARKAEAHFDGVPVVRREESLSNHMDVVFANMPTPIVGFRQTTRRTPPLEGTCDIDEEGELLDMSATSTKTVYIGAVSWQKLCLLEPLHRFVEGRLNNCEKNVSGVDRQVCCDICRD